MFHNEKYPSVVLTIFTFLKVDIILFLFRFSVQLNKTYAKTFCSTTCQAVLDTGSNKIGVPKEYVANINDLIDAEEYFHNRYVVSKVGIVVSVTSLHHPLSFLIDHVHMFKSCRNEVHRIKCWSENQKNKNKPNKKLEFKKYTQTLHSLNISISRYQLKCYQRIKNC